MARFLVTGGCGFIGSHLADSLVADGHEVTILDDLSTGRRENAPDGVEMLIGDVADPAAVKRAISGVDGCFHLAAIASVQRSNQEWRATHRANLTGTIELFDAARNASSDSGPVPVVYASSAAVYGDNQAVPLTEDEPPRPLTAYGADKLGCEHHARVAAVVHGVSTVGLRFFNIYGPRQDPNSPYSGVISIFADRIARGASIEIHGDGGQTRDFVFVADCIAHVRAAMDVLGNPGAMQAEVANVCTGRSTSVIELTQTLSFIAGATPKITFGPARAGDIRRSLGDPAHARNLLGVSADTEISAGLAALLGIASVSAVASG